MTRYKKAKYKGIGYRNREAIYRLYDGHSPFKEFIKAVSERSQQHIGIRNWLAQKNHNEDFGQPVCPMINVGKLPLWLYGDPYFANGLVVFQLLNMGKTLNIYHFERVFPHDPESYVIAFVNGLNKKEKGN